MTEDDNDDSDIDDDLGEAEGDDIEIDSDLEYYLSDGINNSDVSKLCDICQAAIPPKQKKRDKEVQWFQCVYCKGWLHEKRRKGAARKGNMCPRCHLFIHELISKCHQSTLLVHTYLIEKKTYIFTVKHFHYYISCIYQRLK